MVYSLWTGFFKDKTQRVFDTGMINEAVFNNSHFTNSNGTENPNTEGPH